jgi:hypothetical protein
MRKILIFIICAFCAFTSFAEESFKNSILSGYKNRCVQVMSQKENDKAFITKVCNCEAEVIDENFTTFELIITAGKQMSGVEPTDKEKIKELKVKIKQCKLKS